MPCAPDPSGGDPAVRRPVREGPARSSSPAYSALKASLSQRWYEGVLGGSANEIAYIS